ncbi:hypothetical protein A8713_20355 [Streptomyces sp. SAT1]|nr:hypothetical protein A8713_20355 [Streptomyces sp. SAT1]
MDGGRPPRTGRVVTWPSVTSGALPAVTRQTPSPATSASYVSSVLATSAPIRGGRPPRASRASPWSRSGRAAAGRARNGSPARSAKSISARAAGGCDSGNATSRGFSATTVHAYRSAAGSGSQTKATSTVPSARPAVGFSQLARRSRSSASGRAAVNRERIAGSRPPRPGLVLMPSTSVLRAAARAASTASAPRAHSSSTRRARGAAPHRPG